MNSGAFKLHALALECEGRLTEARKVWIEAAIEQVTDLRNAKSDVALYNGIAEAIACLANAYRPHTKEETRSTVAAFVHRLRRRPSLRSGG